MKSPTNAKAACGLALGGALGMAGTVATQRNLQAAFWAIDGVPLVVATSLLALKFFRKGNDVVAAGFVVFAIGGNVILVGTATTLAGSVPSFAARAALWSAALLLTSIPGEFALWVRLLGMIGSIRPNPADECEDQEWTCPPDKILTAVIAKRGTRRRAGARRWEELLKAA
jgi:hypothetical protein